MAPFVLLAVCFFPGRAHSSEAPQGRVSRQVRAACDREIDSLCREKSPGESAVLLCLEKQRDSCVSPKCSKELKKIEQGLQEIDYYCGEDAGKYCAKVRKEQFETLKCLWERSPSLSAECRRTFAWAKKKVKETLFICRSDTERCCRQAAQERRHLRKCLRSHKADLSETCRRQVEGF